MFEQEAAAGQLLQSTYHVISTVLRAARVQTVMSEGTRGVRRLCKRIVYCAYIPSVQHICSVYWDKKTFG